MRQPVQPKFLEKEYTQMVFCGSSAMSERKPGTNVPYTSSVTTMRLGFLLFTMPTIFFSASDDSATEGGLLGFTTATILIFLLASLASSLSVVCQVWLPSPRVSSALIGTILKLKRSRWQISM